MGLGAGSMTAGAAAPSYSPVTADRPLVFPADYGSHPQFRTEWWYVTGWLTTEHGEPLGFQITFFRAKRDIDENNPSAFTPHQLLIAHCAISDPKRGRLWQDQRIRRAGMGLAEAATGDTDVWIDHWSLKRDATAYTAKIDAEDFTFDLTLPETQPVLLNGDSGVSRKGPSPQAASYYYSLPHLHVAGAITRQGSADRVVGEAWLDHEWSSEYLAPEAAGWDWIGINLADGGALMAFRIRRADGRDLWAGGTLRDASGRSSPFAPNDIRFQPLRIWRSPRTNAEYPVAMQVSAGPITLRLDPLMPDQELDSRASTGTIYWEGAVRATQNGAEET